MLPRELGGIGLLDVEARNEALLLTKAAGLAESDPEKRSHWAALALHRLSRHIVKSPKVSEEAKTHLMVQEIKINQKKLPALHKDLIKCLNKYGLKFETLNPSPTIQRQMPLWHHPGANRQKSQINNGEKADCLRRNHGALIVGDALALVQRLEDPLHSERVTCECDKCDDDRTISGCENPHACVMAAAARLGQIHPKWTGEATAAEKTPETEGESSKIFEPPERITTLAMGLRVMTRRPEEPQEREPAPARRRVIVEPAPDAAEIYIAGKVHAQAGGKARAAVGIFVKVGDNRNSGKCIPVNENQSQYAAELYAALEAVRMTRKETVLTITS
ncbi:hypothetical protein C8J57DRAFT_1080927, partial [Mycena rebaudengoi]